MRKKSYLQFNYVDDETNTKGDIEQLKLWYGYYHKSIKLYEWKSVHQKTIR